MHMLIVETATERAIVSIVDHDELVYHIELAFGLSNSQQLAVSIDNGLKSLGIESYQLSAIVVGVGPGSYTGIRVGAAITQAIAFAAKIPMIGISTLSSFMPSEPNVRFAVMLDAKISGVYLQTASSGPSVVALDKLELPLADIDLIISANCQRLQPKLEAIYGKDRWQWQETAPNPLKMAMIAKEKLAKGDIAKVGALELLYMRKAQAEENL